jgi:tRNA-specific 2-thiouridylase
MRVVVAMSGGVDSSVAASLLVKAGHDVVGLSMQLYDQREGRDAFGSCCSLDDLHDARRVAAAIGIPHYLVNFEERFRRTVVDNFVGEYAAGRTPIPCVHCNAGLKFATLAERAAGLDAGAVATGHYARVEYDEDARRYRLLRSIDRDKDQTYFLFSLTQDQLAHAMFPVGHLTKAQVRHEAAAAGLAVADKPDSHEICFIPDGDAGGYVDRALGAAAPGGGDIVSTDGRSLGRHGGIHRYTVGQRKGLGLSTGVPLYVVEVDAPANRLVVGPREALGQTGLTATGVNWIAGVPPDRPARLTARIRHRPADAPATVTADGDAASVVFDEPQFAITPGQAVVFYCGDEVLGGGWIEASSPRS